MINSNMIELQNKILQLEKQVFLLSQQVYYSDDYANFNTTIDKLEINESNHSAYLTILNWLNEFLSNPKYNKGLYLYGAFGVGKTYFMEAIVNTLSKNNIKSIFIYMPELSRKLKATFNNGSTEQLVQKFKRVPVLILDDIGSEIVTPWLRDEILRAVINYRIHQGLPTLYTSNYSFEGLTNHLLSSDENLVNAHKVLESITYSTDSIFMDWENMRNKY
jgi:primosomal protein DnaI